MMDNFDIPNDIVFNPKPDAIPYNYRISYKVSQICLIMHICGRSSTCSLIKLHIISYALLSKDYMDVVLNFSNKQSDSVIVHFDPAVNRAIDYAIAYGFVKQQTNEKYKLTVQGQNFAKRIMMAQDIMTSEISDLTELSKKLSEKQIEDLVERWRLLYAKD